MRPLVTLVSAAVSVALVGALASPAAAANPPLPLPELGTLVGDSITLEGPLIQNVSLLK